MDNISVGYGFIFGYFSFSVAVIIITICEYIQDKIRIKKGKPLMWHSKDWQGKFFK